MKSRIWIGVAVVAIIAASIFVYWERVYYRPWHPSKVRDRATDCAAEREFAKEMGDRVNEIDKALIEDCIRDGY